MRDVIRLGVVLCSVVAAFQTAPARAEKRVALVIGNGSYAHITHLPNVRNDAAAMAALFKAAKFDAVDVRHNVGAAELRRALREFESRTADADIAVLFYAGHGIEVGQVNYLIPVDARLVTDFDVEDETVPLDRVLQAMEPAKHLRLVILDACRENPFVRMMKRTVAARSVGRGLGRVEPAATNTLVAYATKPNAIAEDGKGPNSPFTAALVRHLVTPGLDLRIALGKVRDEVMAATANKQEPYVTSSLGGEVMSIMPGAPSSGPPTLAARPNDAAEAWAAVKDSASIAQLEVIASRYKGTIYAELALARVAELRKQETALAVLPAAPKPAVGANRPKWMDAPIVNFGPNAIGDRRLRPLDPFLDCADCPVMVVLPAGEFVMGSNEYESARPVRRVTISRLFAVGKYEVTFAEWDACVAAGGCKHRPGDESWGCGKRPVINVSWHDAREYGAWLSRKTGKTYRLLSEAEWEYAARAGTTTRYAFGDTISTRHAQHNATKTVEVGSFPANRFGLHDLHGNVGEWVEDAWHPSYQGVPADGSAWSGVDGDARVLRGGSWSSIPVVLSSHVRLLTHPASRNNITGFRLARTL
jgi:formylglycine-generating enzyme required for sulfatase activity